MAKKRQQHVSGNPAKAAAGVKGGTPKPDERSPLRKGFERRSAPALVLLASMPRWLFPLIMGALLLAGMLVPSPVVGGVLLSLLVLILGWLLALSWPLLGVSARLLRLLVVGGLALITYGRFTGRFG